MKPRASDDACPLCGSRIVKTRKTRGRARLNARCSSRTCPARFRVVTKILVFQPNRSIVVRNVRATRK